MSYAMQGCYFFVMDVLLKELGKPLSRNIHSCSYCIGDVIDLSLICLYRYCLTMNIDSEVSSRGGKLRRRVMCTLLLNI